ncbi:MAG: tyrosine-type recombinase/integrase [Erysipelotrichaceae bacterium]|nr:tyrosine-type recombinase/integrase [Erysipelotrichaceae bacterium]
MDYYRQIMLFKCELELNEKSEATIKKYVRDIKEFIDYIGNDDLSKNLVISYKNILVNKYKPATVNVKIIAINKFLNHIGKQDYKIRLLKIQSQIFASEEKELTIAEYKRLLEAAKDERIGIIIKTISSTGIRISELRYITVDAVKKCKAEINLKGKNRIILIPVTLRRVLMEHINKNNIKEGPIFITKNGKPIDRSNLCKEMKRICDKAHVDKSKVFPHNLRHLFARVFYEEEKDIVRLADVLGHSSINTTRIYTMETGKKHFEVLERVTGLLIATT